MPVLPPLVRVPWPYDMDLAAGHLFQLLFLQGTGRVCSGTPLALGAADLHRDLVLYSGGQLQRNPSSPP